VSRLGGRVVIVTGAARGIGRAFAVRCAAEGACVVTADINADGARDTAEAIVAVGGEALAVGVDIARYESAEAMVQATLGRFGRLDVLVNNAAMMANVARRPFDEIPDAEWDAMMAVNVRGTWNCCRAVVGPMRRQGSGSIVNVASDTILFGVPGLLHYVASKGAIAAMTRSLAHELGADGIRVNTLAPGFTETEAALAQEAGVAALRVHGRALQRMEVPEDLTGTLVYLASADSDFVTGQFIAVNGGYALH